MNLLLVTPSSPILSFFINPRDCRNEGRRAGARLSVSLILDPRDDGRTLSLDGCRNTAGGRPQAVLRTTVSLREQ